MIAFRIWQSAFAKAVVVVSLITPVATVRAEDKPLRLVIPCAFGSAQDQFARAFARLAAGDLGRQVDVDNLPARGVGGPVAATSTIENEQTPYDANCD